MKKLEALSLEALGLAPSPAPAIPAEEIDCFAHTTGPRNAEIVIIGEAWGINEQREKKPFVGQSGMELNRMLKEAGLLREECLCTNVVDARPDSVDNFTKFLVSNQEKKDGKACLEYFGVFCGPELAAGIRKLWRLLAEVNPRLVIVCGNWPLHILTPHASVETKKGYKLPSGIASWRGSQTTSRPCPESGKLYNVLPLIHPAAILREWGWRTVTVHDLRSRAARYLKGNLSWEPPSDVHYHSPSFDLVCLLLNQWIAQLHVSPLLLAVDIETRGRKFISVVGLADEHHTLAIPFFYFDSDGRVVSYFTPGEELYIFSRLRTLLEHPNLEVIGQNFIYDTQFFHRYAGIDVSVKWDTMVMHHLIFPGTPKALHNLAALYCHHYCYWKDESEEWDANHLSAQQMWLYNCKDTRATYEAARQLIRLLELSKNTARYLQRLRAWRLGRTLTLRGINQDTELKKKMSLDVWNQVQKLGDFLLDAVPESARYTKSGKPWFSWSGRIGVGGIMDLLYRHLGLKTIVNKDSGNPTADDSAIQQLLEDPKNEWLEPLLGRLAAIRSARVFKSHFLDTAADPSGRMVFQTNIAQPETFRWSTRDNAFGEGGNGQNIPKVED
jgi:uracil-DNA glycosylase